MKGRFLRKILAVALTGTMIFSLAACGSSEKNTSEGSNLENNTEEDSSDKTKISFWAPFSGGDGDIMTAMVDEFNAQSKTTEVEFMIFKSEEYYTKLLAAMTSDSAPTVAVNHITRIKEYVTDDLLEPIDELANSVGVDWEGFTDNLQPVLTVNEQHYCLPMDTHLLLMWFNTDDYKEMGLLEDDGTVQVPAGETEFFEFFENVKASSSKMPLSGTSSNALPMYLWYTLLTQYGGDICDSEGTTATLDTDANRKALEIMMKMVDDEIWPKNQKNGAELFSGGVSSGMINGDWAMPTMEGTEGINFVPMPFPQIGPEQSVYADSHTLVIPRNTNLTEDQKNSAIEFMKWVIDNTDQWAQAGHLPSQKSVLESDSFTSLPYRSIYAPSVEYAKIYPQVCGVAGLTELSYRELAAMISGEQDIETTVNNMQTEFQKILDSYNK